MCAYSKLEPLTNHKRDIRSNNADVLRGSTENEETKPGLHIRTRIHGAMGLRRMLTRAHRRLCAFPTATLPRKGKRAQSSPVFDFLSVFITQVEFTGSEREIAIEWFGYLGDLTPGYSKECAHSEDYRNRTRTG